MTPEVKILRDALGKIEAGEYVSEVELEDKTTTKIGHYVGRKGMQKIAGRAILEADAVKDGPSEEDKERLTDIAMMRERDITVKDIRWTYLKLMWEWGIT